MNVQYERKHKGKAGNDEWLTPHNMIKALGKFDLDPCAPIDRPWETAATHYTLRDNGLLMPWNGRVWCNPPYGKNTERWLEKCALHKNCIALTFARTETKLFFNSVWPFATAVLFIRGRVKFCKADGTETYNAGAPSILIAYDNDNAEILKQSKIRGKFIYLNN